MAPQKTSHEHADAEATGLYSVSIYSANATHLREYLMDAKTDLISSIEDAELCVRNKLRTTTFEPLVAIITEETNRGFNQVQINVRPVAAT